jgi:serine protease
MTTGSASTVVAVIDTGITAHPEFQSRILPGYDFISDPRTRTTATGGMPTPAIRATGLPSTNAALASRPIRQAGMAPT